MGLRGFGAFLVSGPGSIQDRENTDVCELDKGRAGGMNLGVAGGLKL